MQQRGLHKGDTGLKIAVCNKENILEKIAPKTSLSCCGRNVFCLIPLIREEIYVTTIEVIRKSLRILEALRYLVKVFRYLQQKQRKFCGLFLIVTVQTIPPFSSLIRRTSFLNVDSRYTFKVVVFLHN